MALIALVGFGGVAVLLVPFGLLDFAVAGGNASTLILGTVSLAFAGALAYPAVRSAQFFASAEQRLTMSE